MPPTPITGPESSHAHSPEGKLLEFQAISKSFFGVPVLKQVSFGVRSGHTLGLIGENGAGKSTLMNILGGALAPDGGSMHLAGRPYAPGSPDAATHAGVAFIHQELNLFPNLSIAENVFLGRFPCRGGLIRRRAIRDQTRALLRDVGLELPPDTSVERLSAGERQLVEIAKALAAEPRLLILDEPTTSLTSRETERLFALLGRLRSRGMSMIYISHALSDVLRLCDEIVVLRDGQRVAHAARAEWTVERMIATMVGREIDQLFPKREPRVLHRLLLEVKNLQQPGIVADISFSLHAGEVLGVSGLMGSGRTELARILFGLDPLASGSIRLGGRPIESLTPRQRLASGMAFVTENRREEGLCMEASIADNLALPSVARYARGPAGWIHRPALGAALRRARTAVTLTASAHDTQPVKTLSGGNQQKVVFAKWLLTEPHVLLLDEPTRGIDVGARFEIYSLINQATDRGCGVLMISSEIEELIGMCDRILVMSRGRLKDEIRCHEFDRERILKAALHEGHLESHSGR
jgi:ribose transport system ATP-binding protein